MPHEITGRLGRSQAKCPRCGFAANAKLHLIVSGDSFECPQCLSRDDLTIPMFVAGTGTRNRSITGR